MTRNIKNTALGLALLAASGESFVTQNPSSLRSSSTQSRVIMSPQHLAFSGGAAAAAAAARNNIRRFASSTASLADDDEVTRLRTMARKLRQEAAQLEAEQKAALTKAAEQVFGRLDTDKNGEISVQELQKGLEKMFKMELDAKRADQLLKEFDQNGDGALQLDEFVGVDQFRNRLDALVNQERSLARQEAKQAQALAEQEELMAKQMELVNDKTPSTSDKIVSVLPYLFPLVDGLQFGRFLIEGHPDNPLAIAATVAYALYRSIPFAGFLSFFALNFLSDNPSLNRLVRFNLQQAVSLDIALFVPAFFVALGSGLLTQFAGVTIPTEVVEGSNDAMFFILLSAVAYSSVSSLLGQTPDKLPFISQRVQDRMITPDMFDAEGRFSPFDEDGNLKKNRKDDQDEKKD